MKTALTYGQGFGQSFPAYTAAVHPEGEPQGLNRFISRAMLNISFAPEAGHPEALRAKLEVQENLRFNEAERRAATEQAKREVLQEARDFLIQYRLPIEMQDSDGHTVVAKLVDLGKGMGQRFQMIPHIAKQPYEIIINGEAQETVYALSHSSAIHDYRQNNRVAPSATVDARLVV